MAFSLKSLVFKEAPKKEEEEEQPVKAAPVSKTKPVYGVASVPLPASNIGSPIAASTDYRTVIEEKIKSDDKPGPGYYEFEQALTKMDGKPIPDAQKYEYAFMGFSAMGIEAKTLVQGGFDHLNSLEHFSKDFQQQWEEAYANDVTKKQQEVVDLQKQVEELNKKIQNLQIEATKCEYAMNAEKTAFEIAYNTRYAVMQQNVNNIKTFLNVNENAPTK